jgi:hypothetical protein
VPGPEPGAQEEHPPYDEMIAILHELAVSKMMDPLTYKLTVLPKAIKESRFGQRDLERLMKPIYDKLAAKAAAELGDVPRRANAMRSKRSGRPANCSAMPTASPMRRRRGTAIRRRGRRRRGAFGNMC